MGNAIKAEFRKILSTKAWWALLIPSAAVALLANYSFGVIGSGADAASSADGSAVHVPLGYLSLGLSFSFTSIFASIFGALAMTAENRHRTITTSYLTGQRGTIIGAKLSAYSVFGLGYGVITLAFATIGIAITGSSDALPSAGSWLLISLVGIVVIALWTVAGVGLGGLVSNQIAIMVAIPVYGVVVEPLLRGLFGALRAPTIGSYLPVQVSTDSVVGLALQRFLGELHVPLNGDQLGQISNQIESAAGAPAWWISGLVFIAWTVLFGLLGWGVSRRRDIV